MRKIVYIIIMVAGFLLGIHNVSATTDLELAEKYFFDKYWSVLQSDYDYYLFYANSSLDLVEEPRQNGRSQVLHFMFCLFNESATVDVTKDYNQKITVSHCDVHYQMNITSSTTLSDYASYISTDVSISPHSNLDNISTYRYYKTNYFEEQNGEESTSINLDDIKPLFITIIIVLLLFFFVWLITKAMGW